MARKHESSRCALPIALSDDVLGMVSGGSGRASFGDLSVVKVTDKGSPKLLHHALLRHACATGKHFPAVRLVL